MLAAHHISGVSNVGADSVQAAAPPRVALTPRGVSAIGLHVRFTFNRSVRVFHDSAPTDLQQSIRRPGDGWCGCLGAGGLGTAPQFRESAVQAHPTRVGHCRGAAGGSDLNHPAVARTALDVPTDAAECCLVPPAAASNVHLRAGATASAYRAAQEHGLDAVCLEDIWRTKLAVRGWSRPLLLRCLSVWLIRHERITIAIFASVHYSA